MMMNCLNKGVYFSKYLNYKKNYLSKLSLVKIKKYISQHILNLPINIVLKRYNYKIIIY